MSVSAKHKKILARAVAMWGEHSQIQVAFGECGEFITMAGRMVQGRASDADIIDEIADVTIMMAQMREIFGAEDVDKRIDFKMDRLDKRIKAQQRIGND